MKKIIVISILILVALAFVLGATHTVSAYNSDNLDPVGYYARATKVIAIDEENDIVTCEDCVGFLWKFYGVEDWYVGSCAVMIMYDNGTPIIFDDIICHVYYNSWTLTLDF